uniref:ORF7a protein n=1 Tax=Bat Coronavirus HpHI19 TaxID=3018840 RepID=A0AA49IDR0_9NIDO|nr:ORF7a protein [Bat Coronavirus HpHI19]
MYFLIVVFYLQCFLWAITPILEACVFHFPYCVYIPSITSYLYSVIGFSFILLGCLLPALVLDILELCAVKVLLVCRFLN